MLPLETDEQLPVPGSCSSVPCSKIPLRIVLLEDLLDHGLDEVGGDGKVDAIGSGVGLAIGSTREGNADNLALQIDQSPTAVAGIDGGVGLDGVGDGDAARFGDGAAQRTASRKTDPSRRRGPARAPGVQWLLRGQAGAVWVGG